MSADTEPQSGGIRKATPDEVRQARADAMRSVDTAELLGPLQRELGQMQVQAAAHGVLIDRLINRVLELEDLLAAEGTPDASDHDQPG